MPLDALAALITLAAAVVLGLVRPGIELLLYVPAWAAAVAACGEYRLPGDAVTRTRRLGQAVLIVPTATLVVADLANYPVPASILIMACASTATIGWGARRYIQAITRRGVRIPGLCHRVVVVGRERAVRDFLDRLSDGPGSRFDVAGICVVGPVGDHDRPVPTLLGLDQCAAGAISLGADGVILLGDSGVDPDDMRRLQRQLARSSVDVFVWTGLVDVAAQRTCLDAIHGLRLLHVRPARLHGASQQLKAVVERPVAALALLAIAPLLIALAVAIRFDSPGPALFRQTRLGRDGKPFTIWKLRTMHLGAESAGAAILDLDEGSGPLFKIRADPRTTRVGRWLRSTSVDELPQLINVVLGQMSLVGPRPALPGEGVQYDSEVRRRLDVKPGITGLWQVSGRSELSWERSMRLDQYYVDNWSLGLDIAILVRTVGAVLNRRGAY